MRRVLLAALAAVILAGGGAAYALTAAPAASQAATVATTGVVHACVKTSSRTLIDVYTAKTPTCPKGSFAIAWNQQGPIGPQGPAGTNGTNGSNGNDGATGPSGSLSVTASTTITNWPESSGWAVNGFSRIVSITRQHAADSAKCGGTPACWFYTFTLADTGGFETVNGQASPNGSSSATIAGVLAGTMTGTAVGQFYASSGTPDGSLVPASADGSAKPASTTAWAELAFANGTQFSGVELTAYDWLYQAPATCEQWNDQINPGDDGQGAGDGNITGVNACT